MNMLEVSNPESICRQVAQIVGARSGEARAIELLETKRSEGFEAWMLFEHGRWIVEWKDSAVEQSETRE